jgi:peroxiredoxin (alkyl hydroperoxide reductase subunit C)
MNNLLQIGKVAPNFLTVGIFKNRLGKIRLSDYHGKKYVLLVFYPANFTSISATELTELSDRIHEFKQLSTQILAVSIDSPFSHLHYLLLKRSQGGLAELQYPLVSDLNQAVTKKYGLLTQDGLSFPGVFIIDKEGIIQYYTVNNLLCGRNIDEWLRALKSIQYIKENPGQACPINWKNGDQILYSHPLKSKVYFKTFYSQKYD